MSQTSTGLSKSERKRLRGKPAKAAKLPKKVYQPPDPAALLYTRQHSRRVLSCSLTTIIRFEDAGLLDAIKLNPESPNAKTYHRASQVQALARGDR